MGAHQDILKGALWSPEPGVVDVRQEILDAVYAKLNVEDVRPLTDTVTVQAPELMEYA